MAKGKKNIGAGEGGVLFIEGRHRGKFMKGNIILREEITNYNPKEY